MKPLLLYALALLAIVIIGIGCKGKKDGIVGTWTSPTGLTITLESDKSFSMAARSTEDFGGKWHLDGDNVSLDVSTLGGKPIDEALREKVEQARNPVKMSPSDLATAIAASKSAFNGISLKVAADEKSLSWTSNGQTIVFSQSEPDAKANVADEAQIKAHLRLGMGSHEVMEYFHRSDFAAESGPEDPTLLTSKFELDGVSDPTSVIVRYRMAKGKPGLESIEIVKGNKHRQVPLEGP